MTASLSRILRYLDLLLVALVALAGPPAVQADVTRAGPDESQSEAYGPLASGQTVAGAFTAPTDVDYLAFNVAQPGETVDVTLDNATASCTDPNDSGCPVYATFMDATGNQVGGEGSTAGTIATANDTETVSWTFATAGTYYVLLESNGDLPAGSPSYSVTLSVPVSGITGTTGATGSGSGTSASSPPGTPSSTTVGSGRSRDVVRLLRLTGAPHARVWTLAFAHTSLADALSVAVRVPGSRIILRRRLGRLPAGTDRVRLVVPAGLRRRLSHRSRPLTVTVSLTALSADGGRTALTRRMTLVL